MPDKRSPEDLSLQELERLLFIKRREARLERLRQMPAKDGRVDIGRLKNEETAFSAAPETEQPSSVEAKATGRPARQGLRERLLLGLEVTALLGLVAVLISSYLNLRELNQEVSSALEREVQGEAPTAEAAPIALERLPGGHTPPTSPGGAVPDIPAHLQKWVQPPPPIPVPTPAVGPPTRIVIPKIGVDAPIVEGVTWEDLKKGVGHLPGSAHPGERGNLYLAAHNDIYGEIFRYLEKMEPGDEFFVYSGDKSFRYIAREKRIIEPTDVSVMYPTTTPVATLQTCHPYLVNSHRLVVISELAE